MTDADGRVTRYTYDAANRLAFTIDPENRQTKKVYDAASQVIEDRRGVGTANEQAYATFAYTPNGKQLWIKDAKLNQTTYAYDGYDRLEKTTFPDTTFETLTYNVRDKVRFKRTRGNQIIENTYDALDRVETASVPQPGGALAILTTTTYDLASRVTGKSDDTGHSLTYGFDTAKRPISVTQAAPTFAGTRVVSYLLDLAGNKTRTTWADGYYVTYAYDALGRMTTATENGTFLLSTYIYDTLSRRTSLVYGNGASQGYTYTTQGDLLTLASTLTGASNTYTNTFSNAHQLASEGASNAAWAYVPAAFQTTNYSAANPLNQYVNVTVGANPTQTMAYDANGNLTGDGVWTFAYDAQNMLRSAASAGGTSTYQYDPLGRRQMLTEGATTTTFLHDGDEEIADYAAATVLRRYVPGPGTDMPIAMVTPSGGSQVRKYFHTNRQGSTIAMSADDGTMAEGPYTYDAYGNGAAATGVPFKYTGRRLDAGTGLYYYRARYYSAALGRFLQVDPLGYGDQMNLYAYVRSDPVNAIDANGKRTTFLFSYDPDKTWGDHVGMHLDHGGSNGGEFVYDPSGSYMRRVQTPGGESRVGPRCSTCGYFDDDDPDNPGLNTLQSYSEYLVSGAKWSSVEVTFNTSPEEEAIMGARAREFGESGGTWVCAQNTSDAARGAKTFSNFSVVSTPKGLMGQVFQKLREVGGSVKITTKQQVTGSRIPQRVTRTYIVPPPRMPSEKK